MWGQISYSICFDCFAYMFQELDPVNALPPGATQEHQAHAAPPRGHPTPTATSMGPQRVPPALCGSASCPQVDIIGPPEATGRF